MTRSAYPVLIVDDELDCIETFRVNFEDAFQVLSATNGDEALAVLHSHPVAVMVTDQRMPGMHGLEVIRRGREIHPDLQCIILTGYTNDRDLITAVNLRSINRYIAKPYDPEELGHWVERALGDFELIQENKRLTEELRRANKRLRAENSFLLRSAMPAPVIVGTSPAMDTVREAIARVAPQKTTVLILGETGTGKELVARAIHAASGRAERLFVSVNCATIAQNIPESMLFGHRKGAFTSAIADQKGFFEEADGGTLFLDEVGELTLIVQAMLLRVLQEGEIVRVGETSPRRVDVRVIAATNRKLEDEVLEKRFRDDLYYRLDRFQIVSPPLRERAGDLGMLARHFLRTHASEMSRPEPAMSAEVLLAFLRYRFPGNLRELSNILERALILADPGETIGLAHLPANVHEESLAAGTDGTLKTMVSEFERRLIAEWLAELEGNKAHTAARLGMTYRGLLKKMDHLGMRKTEDKA